MKKRNKLLSNIVFGGIILFFIIIVSGIFVFFYYSRRLPDPNAWQDRKVIQSTKIYDRTGETIMYEIHGEEKRTIIQFHDIPKIVKDATVVAEDEQFYRHSGINYRGILRAIWSDIKGGALVEGGSSITQQLIKNAYLSPERTLSRKIKEFILAIALERRYSKDEILNFYLNQIPYGSNSYGIEAASQTYFNKRAKDLTLAETVYLAVLPRATSYYSPYGNHTEELKKQANRILGRMYELKYISDDEYQSALSAAVNFKNRETGIIAPHFIMFIKDYLTQKYGEDVVERGGLKVATTIDLNLQKIAETAIENGAEKNKAYNANNAALVAIDPKTGQILAMVGSKNYNGAPEPEGCEPGKNCQFEPFVNIATRLRQPGSSFKPFAYATAISKGFTPDTIIWDVPTEFNPLCSWDGIAGPDTIQQSCYSPKNYDGKFRGPVTFRQALSNSLNIPSVKILYLAGIDETINTAEKMGIGTLKDRVRYGLSLVLGAAEVRLLDLVSAYGVFSQNGIQRNPTGILKIEDGNGRILEEYKNNEGQRVVDEQTAKIINDILSDNNARAPMFGLNSSLSLGSRPAAAKTGTTQDPNDPTKSKDAWMIGYTPSLIAGVWVGNNNNAPIGKGGAGVIVASPIWREFMIEALKESPIETFEKPDPIFTDKPILNGQYQIVANPDILNSFQNGQSPEIHNILYWVDKNNPQGNPLVDPANDPQFANWEASLQRWIGVNKF